MSKITLTDKLGYGSAAIGDSVAYTFMNTFLLFFLTTIAGIQPAVAGTLTIIGAIWNAIMNPVIGYISDNIQTKFGRRRPFMMVFAMPLAAVMGLMFSLIGFEGFAKTLYYGFMIIAFWTCYTGFFVPYYALGSEYSNNYEDQNSIRAFASFFNMVGAFMAMGLPTLMVSGFEKIGFTTAHGWQLTAFILGVVTAITILITAFVSKSKDRACNTQTNAKAKFSLKDMATEYLQVLALKPMKWLLVCSLFYLVAFAMCISDLVYFLTYNMNYSAGGVSLCMMMRSSVAIIFIPFIAYLSNKTDKRTALIILVIGGSIGCVLTRFLPIDGVVLSCAVIFFAGALAASYWQVVPALFYDVCEYDVITTGKERQGSILAVQGLVESLASGIGAQLLGIILQFGQFDGSAALQNETARSWIFNCTTLVPVVFLLAALFALIKYPITRKVYEELQRSKTK